MHLHSKSIIPLINTHTKHQNTINCLSATQLPFRIVINQSIHTHDLHKHRSIYLPHPSKPPARHPSTRPIWAPSPQQPTHTHTHIRVRYTCFLVQLTHSPTPTLS
ncbi:hypothetical protein M431DRAFT_515874 [Trichoderma harzianum CBS 226.95]|uniref:Uncharacterized protein n=1 Tax=Trichoderma harzianum CBS 226.95 TaxID=983964 RepID=A0A2T4AP46_TRIHA|nr:hypothetical protein M431DRAFT_515874 [Trichoderma harzianum CBS 226.95]PTB58688.1 hypothetical protein M431DRAFT_515874 [Trichoderma harzianum CBS 226.95]